MARRRTIATGVGLAALALAAPASAATIPVGVANDELNGDGDCSLREAVQSANTNTVVSGCVKGQGGTRDTVELAPGEQYQLTIASTDEDLNANGDLDLTAGGPVTVKGNSRGMGGPTIYATATDRAIEAVDVGAAVKVKKLNLEGGDVSGLGAEDNEGGVLLANDSPLQIDDVNLEHGTAVLGGAIAATGAKLTVSDSFLGQGDAVEGGGIYALRMKRLRLIRSGVVSNDAVGTVTRGGGLVSHADVSEIVDTEIEFNSAESSAPNGIVHGGGIFTTSDELVVRRSLIQGNDAQDAGGASSSFGGGLDSLGKKVEVVNSTIFDNDADGTGGGIYARRGPVSNVTFSGNDAGDAGDHMAAVGDGPLKIRNSIIPGAMGVTDLCAGDPGSFISQGYSVIQFDDSTCAFLDSDAVVPDVGFADGTPLPNGGPTFTMGIEGTSPAKNLIPKRNCKVAEGEDQRGYRRPQGKRCDAGAFERGAQP